MKRSYKILRAILVMLLSVTLLLPAALYVIMALPPIQDVARRIGEDELSKLLGTNIEIGSVTFTPYNKVTVRDIVIDDEQGDTVAYIKRLGAGIDLNQLFTHRKIVVTYTELIGLDGRIWRDSTNAPLNIQPIIDALKPKDKNKPPTKFDLKINTVVIRRSSLAYDVKSEPIDSGKFDRSHILISDFNADIHIPRIKNDDFDIDVRRFTLAERSGLKLTDMHGQFHVSSSGAELKDMAVSLPNTHLMLSDISLKYDGWNDLNQRLKEIPVSITTNQGSYMSLADLGWLVPHLNEIDERLNLDIDIYGCLNNVSINRLNIASEERDIDIALKGAVKNVMHPDSMTAEIPDMKIYCNGIYLSELLTPIQSIGYKTRQQLSLLGHVALTGRLNATQHSGVVDCQMTTNQGKIKLETEYNRNSLKSPINLRGTLSTDGFNIGRVINHTDLGEVAVNTSFDFTLNKNKHSGTIEINAPHVDYKGYCYSNINIFATAEDDKYSGSMNIDDNNINLSLAAEAVIDNDMPEISVHAEAINVATDSLNLLDRYPGYKLSASVDAEYDGKDFEAATALLSVNGFKFINAVNEGIVIDNINIEVDNATYPQHISLNSDLIDGRIEGEYRLATIVTEVKEILARSFPDVFNRQETVLTDDKRNNTDITGHYNKFEYNFTIKDNNELTDFFNTPVKLIHPITINGNMDYARKQMSLHVDAPYLQQNYKLIKNSAIRFDVDSLSDMCQFYITTLMPTKNGEANIAVDCNGGDNRLDTDISWEINRQRAFNGNVSLSTLFGKIIDENGQSLTADIDINRSELVFNDTVWTINPAHISVAGKEVSVKGFDVRRDNQYITLEGKASPDPNDRLLLKLLNVNLDYVFETLAINNVMFGGTATGTFNASNLFSKEPHLDTPGLQVKGLSYNYAVLGNALIKSRWVNEEKAVTIDATINQPNNRESYINGAIFPMNDSLDFRFKADKINVGFMNPFMSAFAKEVTGYASGDARLWGNFKYIDMTGDIFAEDLRLKIDFTNTYYTATDSVHLKPGYIEFEGIELKDMHGNKAKLGGHLKHYCFKRPEYEFRITDAVNFLSYDETEARNPLWFGRIYGNGSATVTGYPGNVDIKVKMSTAPKSTFTFVLSDAEEAAEYNFITFRDRNKMSAQDNIIPIDPKLEKVKQLEAIIAERQRQQISITNYNMDIQVAATPEAEMVLVMDPIGGDRIRAHGSGDLHMTYASENEDLFMYGTYVLQDGKYNFTLQDIIIKDFIIDNGSYIRFDKDPLAAELKIDAIYPLNANLSDLDESFLQDKDLNRTNVPVQAKMYITGDMRQPDVKFDLGFPTLSQDVYRKVKSIISTDDMMSRQIIYLLALNRFYTPEYMASTTQGNELVSVASSTISSQLSNILGELSDNWNISPNFRSDKGDFSDVEVDLALSSRLLNNRLLFNGNFGYRDKTMNNNSFIGDFDIEYLLNRSGNIRLKAYNRYNDQNYYVKTALTTQGVGVVFKRDFDNMFSFLRRKKKQETDSATAVQDSIKVLPVPIPVEPK